MSDSDFAELHGGSLFHEKIPEKLEQSYNDVSALPVVGTTDVETDVSFQAILDISLESASEVVRKPEVLFNLDHSDACKYILRKLESEEAALMQTEQEADEADAALAAASLIFNDESELVESCDSLQIDFPDNASTMSSSRRSSIDPLRKFELVVPDDVNEQEEAFTAAKDQDADDDVDDSDNEPQEPIATSEKTSVHAAESKSSDKLSKAKAAEKLVHTFEADGVRAACVVSSKHVWTGQRDGVVVRDIDKGSEVHRVDTGVFTTGVWSMCLVLKTVWVGTATGPILRYKTKNRKEIASIIKHQGGVYAIFYSKISNSVFSCSNDFTVVQWKPKGAFLKHFTGHKNGVRGAIAVGPKLWTCSDDCTVRVWDLASSSCDAVIDHRRSVGLLATEAASSAGGSRDASTGSALCLATDGECVWTGADDGCMRVFSLSPPYRCIAATTAASAAQGLGETVSSEGHRITSVAVMGGVMWAVGQDRGIGIWDRNKFGAPRLLRRLPGHTSFVNSLCRVKCIETRTIWSLSSGDNSLRVWRQECTGAPVGTSGGDEIQMISEDSALDLAEARAANATITAHAKAMEARHAKTERREAALNKEIERLMALLKSARSLSVASEQMQAELLSKVAAISLKLATSESKATRYATLEIALRRCLDASRHAITALETDWANLTENLQAAVEARER
jgi:WD40 repeat protein